MKETAKLEKAAYELENASYDRKQMFPFISETC